MRAWEAKAIMTFGKTAAELWVLYPPDAEAVVRGALKFLHGRSLAERISGVFEFLRNCQGKPSTTPAQGGERV